MSSTLEASVLMVKSYSDNLHSIKNTWKNLTFKQMFDVSEKLITEQSGGFLECLKSSGKILHGDNYLWSMMKKSPVSRMQRFSFFQKKSVLCLGKVRTQHQVLFGKNSWVGSKIHHNTETTDTSDGERMDIEWNTCPGFTTLQLIDEVHKFMSKMGEKLENQNNSFQGRIIFMSMFNDTIRGNKDNENGMYC